MIQIDDAGYGFIVGGCIIGAYRPETGQFVHGLIRPQDFQGDAFKSKAYLKTAVAIVARLLESLNARKDEQVQVCTGFIFNGVRKWLTQQGYQWEEAKITGSLQEKVEGKLLAHLVRLGVEVDYETLTEKQGLAFFKGLQWIKGGNPHRIKQAIPERVTQCKTGWPSFSIWADNLYADAKKMAQKKGKRPPRPPVTQEPPQAQLAF